MKTNEVKACVTQQLRRLQVLPEPQRRAELAELRRGVGRQPRETCLRCGALCWPTCRSSCRAAMACQRRNGPSIRR